MSGENPRERYRRIERRAFERYVRDVVAESALEEERVHREIREEDYNILVRAVDVVGEYPDTTIRVTTFDRVRELEQVKVYPLWRDDDYVGSDGRMKPVSYIAGQILMMARGG